MGLRFTLLAAALSALSAGPTSIIRVATFGDSRADLDPTTTGPDLFDGVRRDVRATELVQPASAFLPLFMPDCDFIGNFGLSGSEVSGWDGARSFGRTFVAMLAAEPDLVIWQYGTNDFQNDVSDSTTRDSVSARAIADSQEAITDLIEAGIKVVFETCMQRRESVGTFAYGSGAVFKRDACDAYNTAMLAWCATQDTSMLAVADNRAAMNIGGATTGAYASASFIPDGAHNNARGGVAVARLDAAAARTLFADRGLPTMLRGTGNNLIHEVSATTVPAPTAINCSASAASYGTVDDDEYVQWTVTPGGSDSLFIVQILADVGTNGGRTPPNTFASGDKLKAEYLLTLDDGSGGAPSATNAWSLFYTTLLTAGLQQVWNGGNFHAPSAFSAGAVVDGRVSLTALEMPAGSEQIGAPSAGSGMRLHLIFYAPASGAAYRVRIRRPQIRAIT